MFEALVCELWVVTWRCCVVLTLLGRAVLVVGGVRTMHRGLVVAIGDGGERGW